MASIIYVLAIVHCTVKKVWRPPSLILRETEAELSAKFNLSCEL